MTFGKLFTAVTLVGVMTFGVVTPAQAADAAKVSLYAESGTDKFKALVNTPGGLVATKECNWPGNPNWYVPAKFVLLRFQVRNGAGRVVAENSRCVNNNWDKEYWNWDQAGLPLGTYRVVAKATFKEEGRGAKTVVSGTLLRTKVKTTRYKYRYVGRNGHQTSGRNCARQAYGSCSFYNYSEGELFVVATEARATATYKVSKPRGTKYIGTSVGVSRFNGRKPQVTKVRNGRHVTVAVKFDGTGPEFVDQTSGSVYGVSLRYRKSYVVVDWRRGK